MNFAVMYNSSDVIWVEREMVDYHINHGWKLLKYTLTEKQAEDEAEKFCYVPISE